MPLSQQTEASYRSRSLDLVLGQPARHPDRADRVHPDDRVVVLGVHEYHSVPVHPRDDTGQPLAPDQDLHNCVVVVRPVERSSHCRSWNSACSGSPPALPKSPLFGVEEKIACGMRRCLPSDLLISSCRATLSSERAHRGKSLVTGPDQCRGHACDRRQGPSEGRPAPSVGMLEGRIEASGSPPTGQRETSTCTWSRCSRIDRSPAGPRPGRGSRATRSDEGRRPVQIRSSKITVVDAEPVGLGDQVAGDRPAATLVVRARPAGRTRRSPGPRSAPSPACDRRHAARGEPAERQVAEGRRQVGTHGGRARRQPGAVQVGRAARRGRRRRCTRTRPASCRSAPRRAPGRPARGRRRRPGSRSAAPPALPR